MHTYHS